MIEAETGFFSRSGITTNADAIASGEGLPRTAATVSDVAGRAGVPLDSVVIRIIDDPEYIRYLDSQAANATTPTELRGTEIHLGPAAFADETMLARTLGHEWAHVLQLRRGVEVNSASLRGLESEAYAREQQYINRLLGRE
ncbi:MAG: eCIS core domain-containing protein [Dehalococcoidia bacterium]